MANQQDAKCSKFRNPPPLLPDFCEIHFLPSSTEPRGTEARLGGIKFSQRELVHYVRSRAGKKAAGAPGGSPRARARAQGSQKMEGWSWAGASAASEGLSGALPTLGTSHRFLRLLLNFK